MDIVTTSSRLREAFLQASWGHRVFPVHTITEAGLCSCGIIACEAPGKHPRISGWQREASGDEGKLTDWWEQWPDANLGVLCGPSSDLLVVDLDISDEKDGLQDLQRLDPAGLGAEGIQSPKVRTGRGGLHLYFRWPRSCRLTVGSGIGGLAIDFRGARGYVVGPGSTNAAGPYEWVPGFSLEDIEKLEASDWLLAFLSGGKAPAGPSGNGHAEGLTFTLQHDLSTHPGAPAGERNGLLCKLVGVALASGQAPDAVMQEAIAWNRRCRPPKAEAGIRKSVWALIASELRTLKEKASAPKLLLPSPSAEQVLICRKASDITPQVLRWLWPNHLQLGAVNLIAGPEGRGKSLVAVDIAARTSTGSPWPDGSDCEGGRVLYCSAEEHIEAVVVPRLMAAGADLSRVEIVDGLGASTDEGRVIADVDLKRCLPAVHRKLAEGGFRLCVWDTFQSVCLTSDHKSNVEQKAILQPLQAIADELGLAMLLIEHHNRGGLGRSGGNPDSVILGGGLTRTARVIWHVVEDPKDTESGRLFLPGKMNNTCRPEGWRFGFAEVALTIGGLPRKLPRIDWLEPAGVTIQEVQDGLNGSGESSEDGSAEFQRACEWLRSFITEPRLQEDVKAGWKSEMFSERTIRRAKAHLLIGSEQRDRKWYWLPSPQVLIGSEVIGSHIAKE